MTKDTKQTLLGIGVLAALGFYLMHKKRQILEGAEETSNASGCRHPRFWCASLKRCVSSAASCRGSVLRPRPL